MTEGVDPEGVSFDDIRFPGVSTWCPLDLDIPSEELVAQLTATYGDDELTATVAVALAGIAARLVHEGDPEVLTLYAWVRTSSDDVLDPLELATLRVLRHDNDDPLEIVQGLVGGLELYSAVESDTLETESGPAHTARWRSVMNVADERTVHEDVAVMWMRPQLGIVFLLSAHSTDLVTAATLPTALHVLAQGITGL